MRGGDALSWVVWRPAVTKPGRGVTGGEEVLERVSPEAGKPSGCLFIQESGKLDWWARVQYENLDLRRAGVRDGRGEKDTRP